MRNYPKIWLPLKEPNEINIGEDQDLGFTIHNSYVTGGIIGKAVNMPGVDSDRIESTFNMSDFNLKYIQGKSFSTSIFFKTSGLGTGQTVGGVISLGYGIRINIGSNGHIYPGFIQYNEGFSGDKAGISPNETVQINPNVSLFDNKWHNLVLTFESLDNQSKWTFYIDGKILKYYIFRGQMVLTYTNPFYIGRDPNNNIYNFKGQFNNFKFYDYVLSAREAYEESLALALHYDFNGYIYDRPNPNLLQNPTFKQYGTSSWGGMTTTRFKAINNITLPIQNDPIELYCYKDPDNTSGGGCVAGDCTDDSGNKWFDVNPNTEYTASIFVRCNNFHIDDKISANHIYIREYSTTSNQVKEAGYANKAKKQYYGNGWWRLWGTFTTQSTTKFLVFQFYTYPNTTIVYNVAGPKIELGSAMTGYTPDKIIDMNESIISDSSGLNRYGISTIGYGSNPTPAPLRKTYVTDKLNPVDMRTHNISGAFYHDATTSGLRDIELCTVNMWIKRDTAISNRIMLFSGKKTGSDPYVGAMDTSGIFYSNAANDIEKYYVDGVIATRVPYDSDWHMITVTNVKLSTFEIFGVNYYSMASSSNYWELNSDLLDLKIFGRTLSDEEVLQMYQESASIANDSVLLTNYIYEEPIDSNNLIRQGDMNNVEEDWVFPYNFNEELQAAQLSSSAWTKEYIAIEPNTNYFLSYDIYYETAPTTTKAFYFVMVPYDNKQSGNLNYTQTSPAKRSWSWTNLAQALNPGDTTVVVDNIDPNWTISTGPEYARRIGLMTDPVYGYNRTNNMIYYTSYSGNTFTLKEVYSGTTMPVDTKIANCTDGSGYEYPTGSIGYNESTHLKKWNTYSITFNSSDFRFGTRYVRLAVLNYGATIYFKNMRLENLDNVQTRIIAGAENIAKIDGNKIVTSNEFINSSMKIRYVRAKANGSTANTGTHFCGIQVLSPEGIDLSYAKYDSSKSNHWILVRGAPTSANPYYSPSANAWVQIDLQKIFDVSTVKVWHYFGDPRSYHDNVVQVSEDNVNWVTIYDSNIDGEYPETIDGLTIDLSEKTYKQMSNGQIYSKDIIER